MSINIRTFFIINIDKSKRSEYNEVSTDNTERGGRMARAFSTKRDVYLEIAERYEKYITLGVLKIGDRLPSVRVAAGELGVNPNTVQRAYTLLEERGLIRTIPKKGVFVTFGNNDEGRDEIRCEAVSAVMRLKEMGVSREELSKIIEEVYAND